MCGEGRGHFDYCNGESDHLLNFLGTVLHKSTNICGKNYDILIPYGQNTLQFVMQLPNFVYMCYSSYSFVLACITTVAF